MLYEGLDGWGWGWIIMEIFGPLLLLDKEILKKWLMLSFR